MSRLFTCGWETGAAAESPGTVHTVVASPARSGGFAAQFNASGFSQLYSAGLVLGRNYYIRAWIRFSAPPSANMPIIFTNNGTTIGFTVRVNTTGSIALLRGSTSVGTSPTLAVDTWHLVQLRFKHIAGTNDEGELLVNGVSVANVVGTAATDAAPLLYIGRFATGTFNIYFDDVAVNDDQAAAENSWPSDNGTVIFLKPVADSARSSDWSAGAGGTTNLWDAVDNIPPVGSGSPTNTTQVYNNTSNYPNGYEAALETYAAKLTGLIKLVQPVMWHGCGSSGGGLNQGIAGVSNPASAQVSAAVPTSTVSAFPANWSLVRGNITYGDITDRNTGAVVQAQKTSASSVLTYVCQMGMLVEYVPVISGPTYDDIAVGTVAISEGPFTERKIGNDAASGPLALAGSVIESSFIKTVYADAPTGRIAFTGSLVESAYRVYTDARTGGLPLAGTAVDSWKVTHGFSDIPVGTFAVAGTCTATYARKDVVGGSLVFTGGMLEKPGFTDRPVGTLRLWDWAAEHPQYTPRPVGIPGALVTSVLRSSASDIAGGVPNPLVLRPPTGSGYAVGDLLLCFAAVSAAGSAGTSLASASSGWVVSVVPPAGVTEVPHKIYLVGKLAQSLEEPPPTLTFNTTPGPNGTPAIARIVAFRGLDTSDLTAIKDVVSDSALNTGPTYTIGGKAITTTLPNDLVFALSDVLDTHDPSVPQPPTGFTMLTWDAVDSGRGIMGGWAYQVKRTPGLLPAPSFTLGGATNWISGGVQVALKAALVTGTFKLSGTVQESLVRRSSPAGTIKLAGSRVERRGFNDSAQGTIKLAGTADEHYLPPTVDGILPLTGSVVESWRHVGAFAGRITLSGSVVEERFFSDDVAGDIAINGTVSEQRRTTDKCAGVLKLIGVVSEELVAYVAPQGTIRLRGINSEFITIDDAIFYDDFPGGLLAINGRTVFIDYSIEPGRMGRVVTVFDEGRIVRSLDTGRVTRNMTGKLTR